jgi:hypothetical protein
MIYFAFGNHARIRTATIHVIEKITIISRLQVTQVGEKRNDFLS